MKNPPVSSHGVPAAFENKPSVRPLTVNCLHYGPDSEGNGQIWTDDLPSKQVRVATVYGAIGNGDDIEQYARLLASAPDLLAALQRNEQHLADYAKWHTDRWPSESDELNEGLRMLREAIAKAEGTTP